MTDVYCPEQTYDWLTMPDLAILAQNAYKSACLEMTPENGQDFTDSETGILWADRECFHEALTRHLNQQLHLTYALRVMHKSTADIAEEAHAIKRAVATEGSCGPCV